MSYFFAPDTNARALRWGRVVEEWRRNGHEVVVITRPQPGSARTADFHGATVRHVGGRMGGWLRAALGVKDAATGGRAGGRSRPGVLSWAKGTARTIHSSTWRRIYWPDHAAAWIGPARRSANALIRDCTFDALITVSHPFSSHVVGLELKRTFPKLLWLADSGDPFSFLEEIPLNNLNLYRARNHRVEGRVVEHADVLSVTVESCRLAYGETFPQGAGKTVVIPPLVTGSGFAAGGAANAPVNLVYVGTLYQRIRNPGYLLRLLEAVPNLTLDVYGDTNDCIEQFRALPAAVASRVTLHGTVPPLVARQAMAAAGTLVNIGNATRHQLPSKVFEYIATGRPILNLVGGDWDSSLPFLSRYRPCLSVTMSATGPSDRDSAAIVEWLQKVPPAEEGEVERLLSPNRASAVAQAYLDALSSVRP